MVLSRLCLTACLALAACGSSSSGDGAAGGASSGGATSGGSSSGGSSTGGGGAGGVPNGGSGGAATGGAPAGGSGGTGGAAGACAATPGSVKCGSATCDLSSQYCCGGPEAGKCMAKGAFCGLGGGIKLQCDDSADCASGEVCCVGKAPASSNDAEWQAECAAPLSQPAGGPYECGLTGGNLPWPNLCECSAECNVGTCKQGSIPTTVYNQGYWRCE